MKQGFVYILASHKNGSLYIGVTSDLAPRIWQHKNKVFKGHTSRYDIDKLVYYETFDDMDDAIKREKILKDWDRTWKKDLIEKTNPEWNDLYESIIWK